MLKIDDARLDIAIENDIKSKACSILNLANAHGRFPTPISDIMTAVKVQVASEPLNPSLAVQLQNKAGQELYRAISKVLGIYDAKANYVYISPGIHPQREAFLKLHETAHAFLPWQSQIFSVIEDCEKTLDPTIAIQFEREANFFASEVLFQCGSFENEALDYDFSLRTPIALSKKYGASIYSSIRRYISTNDKACAVVVMNPPDSINKQITVRRIITSKKFSLNNMPLWQSQIDVFTELGLEILWADNVSSPRSLFILDQDGSMHRYIAEMFSNTYQIFLFLKECCSSDI